jgi:hypothetical protein
MAVGQTPSPLTSEKAGTAPACVGVVAVEDDTKASETRRNRDTAILFLFTMAP